VTQLLFYELTTGVTWLYDYHSKSKRKWLAGGTLLYTRVFWRRSPFPDLQVASDTRSIFNQRLDRAVVLPQSDFYVATIHLAIRVPNSAGGAIGRAGMEI
jgi:hypothetical protein